MEVLFRGHNKPVMLYETYTVVVCIGGIDILQNATTHYQMTFFDSEQRNCNVIVIYKLWLVE